MTHYRIPLTVVIFVLLCAHGIHAQSDADSIRTDTVRSKYIPSGVRIGTDLIGLVRTRTQTNFRGWEVNGEMDFSRYFLAIDYGSWGRNLHADSVEYANTGDYWRAGIDVNFLRNDPDANVFFLGARYGRSVFTESMDVIRVDPIWGTLTDTFYHTNVHAWWLELTTGLRVKIWKIFWVGYTGRLKFALTTDPSEEMLPHDVPGFGSTNKETTWGFNYYVMVRIPLRKTPPASRDK